MMTVKEVADRCCVCEGVVRSWIKSGQLPHFRVGAIGKRGKILVQVEDLDGFLANFKVGQKPPVPVKPSPKSVFKHLRLK